MPVRRHGGRRRNVVVESAMLVVENDQERRVPEPIILTQGVVDVAQESLCPQSGVRRVIVVLTRPVVARLDEAEGRESFLLATGIAEKHVHELVSPGVLDLTLVAQDERLRNVTVVNAPGNASLVQPVIDRVLVVPEV